MTEDYNPPVFCFAKSSPLCTRGPLSGDVLNKIFEQAFLLRMNKPIEYIGMYELAF